MFTAGIHGSFEQKRNKIRFDEGPLVVIGSRESNVFLEKGPILSHVVCRIYSSLPLHCEGSPGEPASEQAQLCSSEAVFEKPDGSLDLAYGP